MEIERKFIIKQSHLPNLDQYEHYDIVQGYLSRLPEIRIRSKINKLESKFYLTIKSDGSLERTEKEIDISEFQFNELSPCIISNKIEKTRYIIPISHKDINPENIGAFDSDKLIIELDIFKGFLSYLILAEVEFPSIEIANSFLPPKWFDTEVTHEKKYKNKNLAFD
jgi:adenylate cyclase